MPILNFPAEERSYKLLPVEMLQPVQLPFVQEDDLLLQTTRPPLSDGIIPARKKIEPSNTTLERAIFNHFWRYFDECMRKRVVLRNAVADFLPRGFKDRQEMMFHQKGCAYKFLQAPGMSCSAKTPEGNATSAFLLRVESIVPQGPGFIAAFGMNAQVTQGFNRLLRYRFPHLLEGRGLTMVELRPTKAPARPMTDAWMDDWQADVPLRDGCRDAASARRRGGRAGLLAAGRSASSVRERAV